MFSAKRWASPQRHKRQAWELRVMRSTSCTGANNSKVCQKRHLEASCLKSSIYGMSPSDNTTSELIFSSCPCACKQTRLCTHTQTHAPLTLSKGGLIKVQQAAILRLSPKKHCTTHSAAESQYKQSSQRNDARLLRVSYLETSLEGCWGPLHQAGQHNGHPPNCRQENKTMKTKCVLHVKKHIMKNVKLHESIITESGDLTPLFGRNLIKFIA